MQKYRLDGIEKTYYLRFTNRVTRSVQRNTKPKFFFVWPELVRAVRESKGTVLSSTDRVPRLAENRLFYGIIIFN